MCLMDQEALLAVEGCMDQSLRSPETGLSVCMHVTPES